ncbi:hypothetical protein BDU57DRAFT_153876 [Ampelomyces quisqualis]|uniref:Ubiquitin-like protease family profile domain-containing protein n=1 Tax=Ampelomyces quisqualis TaxID=50730 RepID=A0A6A5QVJ6_AMPQU|nr:hypothetical protein BDU57DRAFT_153876 [Ampelomyces quisqualis]
MSNKRAYSELSPSALFIPGQWPKNVSPGGYNAVDARDVHLGRAFLTQIFANIFAAPGRLVQRLFGKQQVIVQPVVREDGARKKRIIDAGPADEPTTPTPAPRTRPIVKRCGRKPRSRLSPPFWAPLTEDFVRTYNKTEPSTPTTSTTPSASTVTPDASASSSAETSLNAPSQSAQASPTPFVGASPSGVGGAVPDDSSKFSPNTHCNIIRKASVTPARRELLVKQALANGAIKLPGAPAADHTVPSPNVEQAQEPTELQQKAYQANLLKNNAAAIALNAQQAHEQYKAQTEARQTTNTDLPILAEPEPLNHVETVNEELSFLSDAPDEEVPVYSEELSFLPDAPDEEIPEDNGESLIALFSPSPEKKTSIRWKVHARTKSFYCDEKVADMLDSTLERINFSPVRRSSIALPEGSSEDDAQSGSEPSASPLKEQGGAQEIIAPVASRGFRAVPDSTWDDSDDSLDESQISIELLEDLQEDVQRKLALATPPPPPQPAVKVLVTPLSSEEEDKLNAAATATDNGKLQAEWLIPQKLNARDFSTLLPGLFSGDPRAWLNDNIVNEYLGLLMAKVKKEAGFEHKRGGPAPPMHIFSSFWYPTLTDRPKNIDRWAARFQLANQQYLDADLILYPICDRGHWRLLVVKPKDRTIEYLDSLTHDGTKYIEALKGYLATELGDAWVEDEWTVLEMQRSIQQINGSDCGIFTILNALALMRGEELTKVLPSDGMLDARERIAVSLLARAPTTEFD